VRTNIVSRIKNAEICNFTWRFMNCSRH